MHTLKQWPDTVFPGEVDDFKEALPALTVLLMQMQAGGPSPLGYQVKNLGAKLNGLWQVNIRVDRRQIRVLFAPYSDHIVVFHIHKKSSPQEQQRAYATAKARKTDFERIKRNGGFRFDTLRSIH